MCNLAHTIEATTIDCIETFTRPDHRLSVPSPCLASAHATAVRLIQNALVRWSGTQDSVDATQEVRRPWERSPRGVAVKVTCCTADVKRCALLTSTTPGARALVPASMSGHSCGSSGARFVAGTGTLCGWHSAVRPLGGSCSPWIHRGGSGGKGGVTCGHAHLGQREWANCGHCTKDRTPRGVDHQGCKADRKH